VRNKKLDLLRGLAILLVIGAHLPLLQVNTGLGIINNLGVRIGWIGVDLFFVLSGYLISGLLFSEHQKKGHIDILHFYIRRGFKIYPAYIVFVVYSCSMLLWDMIKVEPSLTTNMQNLWTIVWPNLVFLNNYIGSNFLHHTYTLAIEEHFYLVLPLLLVVLFRLDKIKMILVVCILSLLVCTWLRYMSFNHWGFSVSNLHSRTHFRIESLFFGVLLKSLPITAPALLNWIKTHCSKMFWIGLGLLAGYLAFFIITDQKTKLLWQNYWIAIYGSTIITVLIGVIFIGYINEIDKKSNAVVEIAKNIVQKIGFYSYSIYIWHITIMGISGKAMLKVVGYKYSVGYYGLIFQTFQTVFIILGGIIIAKIIEVPVLQIRDKYFPTKS